MRRLSIQNLTFHKFFFANDRFSVTPAEGERFARPAPRDKVERGTPFLPKSCRSPFVYPAPQTGQTVLPLPHLCLDKIFKP